jgi:3-phenylpropionate/trans-cinnamate dioxygenase ferredoxin reductase subunit
VGSIVIVGAGQAGASLAAKLRSLGHTGPVTLIGEEPVAPYQRPPLSKAYLSGEAGLDRLFLRSASFWSEHDIALRAGVRAKAIDPGKNTVMLEGGEILIYDQLALTTGSKPRTLPAALGGQLENVFAVRTLAHIDAMASKFRKGARALIVGGGYIGLEAAAVAAKLGLDATVIEAAPRILQRVAAPETSDYFRRLHAGHKVTILEGIGLARLLGERAVTGALLSDGREIEADLAIVGIGIEPDVRLAAEAGLTVDNGICTDEFGRTSDPAIWAAGDCASFPHQGRRIRLESVGNAIDQAEHVAENMMGGVRPYQAKPWFWSDQYETKLQIAGLNTGYDRVVSRLGSDGALSVWYYAGSRLLAVDAMNDARAYMVGKRLIEQNRSPDPASVADTAIDLKSLLK